MLDTRHQPAIESIVQRLGGEISAKAVMILHENGQVIQRSGELGEGEYPAMAALVAAMIATGKSLNALGETFAGAPSRFSCDSEAMGLYMANVTKEIWLVALYDQPLNPGQYRMKVRRYAEVLARIGTARPDAGSPAAVSPAAIPSAPAPSAPSRNAAPAAAPAAAGAITPLAGAGATGAPVSFTSPNSGLFNDISDDEIDALFNDAQSSELRSQ